jgi:hypothetical protein
MMMMMMMTRRHGLTHATRYPPDTPEKKKHLGAFFGKFPPPATAGNVPAFVQAVKEKNPSLSKFGILGVRR